MGLRDYFPPIGGLALRHGLLSDGAGLIDLAAHRDKDLLLIARPVNATVGVTLGRYGPIGSREGREWGWKGMPVTLHVATTSGVTTANDDDPPAQAIPAKLSPSLNFARSLFDGVDPLRRAAPSVGEIKLTDPDGRLDYLLDYIWDGADIVLKRGARGTPLSTWQTVGQFSASDLRADLDAKYIGLRDIGWQLSGPLHGEYYDGAGGLGGDPKIAGQWKPYAAGYVFNAEPKLIHANGQIFQASFTPVESIIELRHGGEALDFDADYPTFEALRDAAIPSGYWGSCLAHGLVRPNVTLQYGIRVDLIGDSTIAYGHPTPTTRGAIARRIATTYGPNRLNDYTQIDVPSFTELESRHPAPCGWYWTSPVSKAQALDEVMAGILGYWKVRPDGMMAVGYVGSPARGSIMNLPYRANGMSAPRIVATAPPRAGTAMGWRRNYGPQQSPDLAGAVVSDAAAVALYSQPASYAQALSPHVSRLYPTSVVVQVAGNFWLEADAAAEATRQQSILEVERKRWQWDMRVDPYLDLTGQVLTLTDFDRLGAGPALSLLNVGMDARGTDATTFDWWG